MERRKFFKSLGALGLAVIIPKFLLGKEEDVIKLRIVDDGSSKRNESWTSWHGGSDFAKAQSDVIWDKTITLDRAIKPEGMKITTWLYFFKTGVLYYDYNKCKIKPKELKELILSGEKTFVRHIDIDRVSDNPINISKLMIIDFKSNRWVDAYGYCNYTSVDRWQC